MATISINRPNVYHHTFGAKIKRSTSSKQVVDITSGEHVWRLQNAKQVQGAKANTIDKSEISHPMQSAYLGSDRRYNSYWLFLGPCEEKDPGHRRVYFESSEDGHWEVIDTMEVILQFPPFWVFTLSHCKKCSFFYLFSGTVFFNFCSRLQRQTGIVSLFLFTGTGSFSLPSNGFSCSNTK